MPETVKRFSYMFRDWETAQAAAREIMQSEGGFPSVFRLSDPEETEIMLRMYGVDESPLHRLFDYVAEASTSADVGLRVRVPFGRGERLGVIVSLD